MFTSLQGLTLDKWLKGLPDLGSPFDCADRLRAADYASVEDIVTAVDARMLKNHTGMSLFKAEIIFRASKGEKCNVYLCFSSGELAPPSGHSRTHFVV